MISAFFCADESNRDGLLVHSVLKALTRMEIKVPFEVAAMPITSANRQQEWTQFVATSPTDPKLCVLDSFTRADVISVSSCKRTRSESADTSRVTISFKRQSRLSGPPVMLWIGVVTTLMEGHAERLKLAINTIAEEIGKESSWHSGYVEEVARSETDSGFVYRTDGCNASRWKQHEVELDGMMGARRAVMVRGVYYGNYFGPQIVKRLGLKQNAISKFESWRDNEGSRGQYVLQTECGGQYWSLGTSPLGSELYGNGGYGDSERLAKFLRNRLRSRRLLM
jgi:hypothetical protein